MGENSEYVCVPGTALVVENQTGGKIHTIRWHHGTSILVDDMHCKCRFLNIFLRVCVGVSGVMGLRWASKTVKRSPRSCHLYRELNSKELIMVAKHSQPREHEDQKLWGRKSLIGRGNSKDRLAGAEGGGGEREESWDQITLINRKKMTRIWDTGEESWHSEDNGALSKDTELGIGPCSEDGCLFFAWCSQYRKNIPLNDNSTDGERCSPPWERVL